MLLLHAVQRLPGRRADELARECGIPLNTARDHLHVLQDEGLIRSESVHRGGRGRPSIAYHPVLEATSSEPAERRVTGAKERGALLRAVTDVAGQELGTAAAAQLDVLYEHLDDAGLDPRNDEDPLTFELNPCRYEDLLGEDQPLVCSVHSCLVRDVLLQVDGPLRVKELQPFVTEHRCRLMLADDSAESHQG